MLHLTALAAVAALAAFACVWYVCVRIKNYGFLDVTWTLSIGALAVLFAWLGDGYPPRRAAFALVGAAWSLRLGLFVLVRVARHHPEEDKRYRTLREQWPGPARFLVFFELQALIAVVFSWPFLAAAQNATPRLGALEIAGLVLAACAVAGESLADWQAQRFKRDARNAAAILDVGLWRYSRHPNYFFESVVWWGFCIAALSSPYGWLSIAPAVLILYFLLRVTGIPLTEKHSLESRGEAYREYQRTTSKFVPWFRSRP